MSTPASRAMVAALCRRSCRRVGGSPAWRTSLRNRWVTPLGCHGRPSGRTKNRPVSGRPSSAAKRRYERVSLIVTSNKPFGRWGGGFNNDVVAATMNDRLAHYTEMISMKGGSYRLKDRDLGRVLAATKTNY